MSKSDEIKKLKERVNALEIELQSIHKTLDSLQTDSTETLQTSTSKISKLNASLSSFRENLELWLGENLIGKAGFLAIILAFIWFLTYAFENYWINESGRIYLSLVVGFSLWGGSFYYAKQNYRKLPVAMLGTGISILFLGIFSAYRYYSLLTIQETFLGMFLLSGVLIWFSWISKSQVLYVFGFLGAFFNPILLSTGENSYRFLFSYLIVFNLVHLLISSRFYWKFSSLFFPLWNLVLYQGWADSYLSKSSFFFPFLFLFVAYIVTFVREIFFQARFSEKLHWSTYLAVLVVVFGYSFQVYELMQIYYNQLYPIVILSFAIIPLVIFLQSKNFIPLSTIVQLLPLVAVVSLYVLVLALQAYAKGEWLYLSYVAVAGALSLFSASTQNKQLFLVSSLVWILAIIYLLFALSTVETKGIFLLNTRFLVYLLSASFMFASFYLQRNQSLSIVSKFYYFFPIAIVVYGTFVEIYYYFENTYYRNLAYSYTLAIYAGVFLISGFIKNSLELRRAGIVLIILLIIKFYIYDIWTLSLFVKIIAAFSLGVGLVVTGMFYEKFKSKLFGEKVMLPLFLFLSFVVCSDKVFAHSFKEKNYKYYKEIKLDSSENISSQIGKIILDEEILSNSNYTDIRVVYDKSLVPFVLRAVREINFVEAGSLEPTIIKKEKISNNTIKFIIKLKDLPKGVVYSSLVVAGNEPFEANVKATPLINQTEEGIPTETKIKFYDLSSDLEENREIKFFTPARYKFVRVEITGTQTEWDFPKAKFVPNFDSKFRSLKIDPSQIQKKDNSDTAETIYYISNPKKIPFQKIQLDFAEDLFEREVSIFEFSEVDKEYNLVTQGKIFKNKQKTHLTLETKREIRGNWKLHVQYGDSVPLNLKEIIVLSSDQEIIFSLQEIFFESDKKLRVYYGNPYVNFPTFDASITYNLETTKEIPILLNLGSQELNPNFAYDILEPPVSSWIIRILFFLGLGLFSFLGYKIYLEYGRSFQQNTSVNIN